MKPITELDILIGMQIDICCLDLNNPNAVECAMALGHAMERQAVRALDEMRGLSAMQSALAQIAADDLNTEEDAAMDSLQARWDRLTDEQKAHAHATLNAEIKELEANRESAH